MCIWRCIENLWAIHSLFECTNDFNEYLILGDYVSDFNDFTILSEDSTDSILCDFLWFLMIAFLVSNERVQWFH